MESSASEAYEKLVVALVAPMLERRDELDVQIARRGGAYAISYTCNPSETGRLIGNRGETVRAVRTLAEFAAGRRGDRVAVDVREG